MTGGDHQNVHRVMPLFLICKFSYTKLRPKRLLRTYLCGWENIKYQARERAKLLVIFYTINNGWMFQQKL